MPNTTEALVVILVFVIPGALYEWAYERQVGHWNIATSDRVIRFIGSATVIHVLIFPITFVVWRGHFQDGSFQAGGPFSWWLWLIVVAGVAIPTALGSLVGWGTRATKPWARPLTGSDPAPRAWDHLFFRGGAGWVRLKLKSGPWVGGQFVEDASNPVRRSYAGGYPNPADLYLLYRAEVDPDSGAWKCDEDGTIELQESGLLVRWDEVELLEFLPAKRLDHDESKQEGRRTGDGRAADQRAV